MNENTPNKTDFPSIITSIRHDPNNWKNWTCLHIEINEEIKDTLFAEKLSWIESFIYSSFTDIKKQVYFCKNHDIHIFCKNVEQNMLEHIGQNMCFFLSEELNIPSNYNVFNLYKNGMEYSLHTLHLKGDEQAIPISAYSKLKPFIPPKMKNSKTPIHHENESICPDGMKVMLIEDDPLTRWVVGKTLKDECRLFAVDCANKAFSGMTAFKPDIIFLDIGLPDKDGEEVLDWILRNDPGANVIMFSSNNSPENIASAIEKGAKGFVAKPFVKSDLMYYLHNNKSKKINILNRG